MNEIMLRPLYNSESSIKKDEYLKYLYHIAERIENTAKEVDREGLRCFHVMETWLLMRKQI